MHKMNEPSTISKVNIKTVNFESSTSSICAYQTFLRLGYRGMHMVLFETCFG